MIVLLEILGSAFFGWFPSALHSDRFVLGIYGLVVLTSALRQKPHAARRLAAVMCGWHTPSDTEEAPACYVDGHASPPPRSSRVVFGAPVSEGSLFSPDSVIVTVRAWQQQRRSSRQ